MKDPGDANSRQDMIQKAQQIKQKYASSLMAKANVVGVGVGRAVRGGKQSGQVALVVLVSRKVAPEMLAQGDLIPPEIEGVPVDVQEVGELKAQQIG